MSRFSSFLSRFGQSREGSGPSPEGLLRGQQRRQKMADATVSLAQVRADAAIMAGRAPDPENPIHPGEILWEEFMKPLGVKAPTTAKALGVPRTRIERLVAGQTALSPDTALRLSRAFTTTTPLFWMNLQAAYDVDMAEQELAKTLAAIRPFKARGAQAANA